jgi:hypothetical protein
MTKKFTFIVIMMLLFGAASYSQTATLGTVASYPGSSVTVPLNVTNWTNVGAITLEIRWTAGYLTYTGITNKDPNLLNPVITANDSVFHLTWTNPLGSTFNGKLFDLNFVFNGTASTTLNFTPSCQVTTVGLSLLPVTYSNGGVNAATGLAQSAAIDNITAATGAMISVPLKYAGFGNNVGAVTQMIHYDATALSFVNLSTAGNLSGAIAYASGGIITITWSNTAGKNINWANGNQFILNFVYNGFSATPLNFAPGCVISTTTPIATIPVTYTNGTVTPGAPVGTCALGNITGAVQGQDYEVPLTLAIPAGISSITLHIPFDSPRLSFIGATSLAKPAQTLVNATGNVINITYTNGSAPTINGVFLKLRFKYNGVGTANVNFGGGCLFTDALLNTLQIGYTNGTIVPGTAAADATIGFVSNVAVGSEVDIPVDFANLPVTMGSATMYLGFDASMLTYIGVMNNTFGATCWSPSSGAVNIAWASAASTNINGTFLKLRFIYNGGGSGTCGSWVSFKDGCEMDNHSAAIVPVNWNNGGVNLKWKISGLLRYDNTPNPLLPLQNFTVYLKNNPSGTTVASVTTDASGYFEFSNFNGNYKLDAAAPGGEAWYGDFDDVVTLFNYSFYADPIPYQTPLRLLAGDVVVNNSIDFDDVVAEFNFAFYGVQPPEFDAPLWLFETPTLGVNCADVANQNFFGLCAGDVLGNNPTP